MICIRKTKFIAALLWVFVIVLLTLQINKRLQLNITYVSNDIRTATYISWHSYKFDYCYNNTCAAGLESDQVRQISSDVQLRYFNSVSGNAGKVEVVLPSRIKNPIRKPACDHNAAIAGYYLTDSTSNNKFGFGYFDKGVVCSQSFIDKYKNINFEYHQIRPDLVYAFIAGNVLNLVSASQLASDIIIGTAANKYYNYIADPSDRAIVFSTDNYAYNSFKEAVLLKKLNNFKSLINFNISCVAYNSEKNGVIACSTIHQELLALFTAFFVWLTIPIFLLLANWGKLYFISQLSRFCKLSISIKTTICAMIIYLLAFAPVYLQFILSAFLSIVLFAKFFLKPNENSM